MSRLRSTLLPTLTLGGALLLPLALAGPASATSLTPEAPAATAPDGAQARERLDVACARVPAAIERLERMQIRLDGDETVRGSTLWLGAQAERADQAGRAELAEALRNRLAVREERAHLLPGRLAALQQAAESCAGRATTGS